MARVDTLKNFLTDIADKFREKLGTTDTISHADYDTKIEEVYDKGEADGRETMRSEIINPEWTIWNSLCAYNRNSLANCIEYSDTSNGTDFSNMFQNCTSLTTVPQLNTSKGTTFGYMFYKCSNLTTVPWFDTSNADYVYSLYTSCSKLKTVPALDTSKSKRLDQMFSNCTSLTTIPKLAISSDCYEFNNMFRNCSSLVEIGFEGTFTVKTNHTTFLTTATKVNQASLHKLIDILSDNSSLSTTYTIGIGSTNLAKVSADYKAIATAKNIKLQ